MSFTTVRVTIGRVVLVGGILVLLFIPYLLWGTGFQTARSQSRLRQEFAATERKLGDTAGAHLIAPHRGSAPLDVAPPLPDPPLGSAVGIISIPKIGLSMVVVEGTGTAQLEAGPGHYPGTPLPGETGNVAIAGHRTTYLHPFYNLNELVPGDAIVIDTVQGEFLYQMTSSQVVSPSDVSVVDDTTSPQLTLTTCNNLGTAPPPGWSSTPTWWPACWPIRRHRRRSPRPRPSPARPRPARFPAKNWLAAIGLGVVVAIVIAGIWIAARKTRRGQRATVIVFGLLAWLVLVFFFFEALAPLLPASY